MPYQDLRDYIARLDEEGDLQRIEEEVDWNLEVGAIIRRSYDLKAPAPFFQKIKGYPAGYRVLGGPVGVSNKPNRLYGRLALSLDLPPETPVGEIMESYIQRKKNLIKPTLVSTGPCKENILLGEEVDLFRFPVPYLHAEDGGRYIGTWHAVVTRDPDTGWVNWGMYRSMVHDRNTLAILMSPHRDIGVHYYQRYEARNQPMEFAIFMGTEPVNPLMSATRIAYGVDEADVIGAIRGQPVELVKCETVDLAVPAAAEIVIEGVVYPHERRLEGPFGEYTGHQTSAQMQPVGHVKAITHRNNPILPVTCVGVPIDDCDAFIPIRRSAEILDDLRTRGFPVKMVHFPPEGIGHLVVISTEVPYANYAWHLASAVWGNPGWGQYTYYVIVVDADVDVTNMEQVIWILSTRCHPDRGITKVSNAPGHQWVSFLNSHERKYGMGACVLFDCTWPKDWPPEDIPPVTSFQNAWPKEIQEKVLSKWQKYGYK